MQVVVVVHLFAVIIHITKVVQLQIIHNINNCEQTLIEK